MNIGFILFGSGLMFGAYLTGNFKLNMLISIIFGAILSIIGAFI